MSMRRGLIALSGALLTLGCGQAAPNPYPDSARMRFDASCPANSARCRCTWDRITRTMTHEEYEAALARFRESGLMDPRVTRARTQCLERHPE
jgi:hypothetical protein